MLVWGGIILGIPCGWYIGLLGRGTDRIYHTLIFSSVFVISVILFAAGGYIEPILGVSLGLILHRAFLCVVRRHIAVTVTRPTNDKQEDELAC